MNQRILKPDLLRCQLAGFDRFTPTNNATLGLFNSSQGAELLVVWVAYPALQVINTCGFGVIQGSIGGTVITPRPLYTSGFVRAGVVTKLDTATSYQLDQFWDLGMSPPTAMNVNLPWAILDPGWSFIIQDQKAGDSFGANVIWQSLFPEELT